MPRLAKSRPFAPRGAWLIVALGAMLAGGPTPAQVTGTFDNPLSPQPDGTGQSGAFQRVDRRALAQADQPTTFAPLPSGAGLTGFDASNAPTRAPPAAANTPTANAPAGNASDANASATGAPPPQRLSPYQQPPPPLPDQALASAPPGSAPVEIGPIRKPKKRKAHADEPTDPFEPAGIHVGTFLLYPAIELIGGYNSNPGATPDGSGAAVYTVAPELQVQSEWARHSLTADLRGSYTGYSPDETPTLSRPEFDGTVHNRFDINRRSRLLLDSHVLVSTDNPGSPNLQAGLSKLPVFFNYGTSGGLQQDFNRFRITARGETQRTSYQHSTLTDGSTVSNTDRNYTQYGARLRGSYETMPGVRPFVEVEADKRVHDTEYDDNGYARDSKGVTGLVGTTFALKYDLTGEIAIGYTRRTYDDARLAPLEGVVGDASLIWTVDALNTVKLSASSTASESTIAGVSGELSRDVGLQFDHAFRRWLIASLKLGYGQDVYKGGTTDSTGVSPICNCVITSAGDTVPDRVDNRYSVGFGITYKVDRTMQVKGEFRQDWLRSNTSGVDYDASTVLLGLRFQR